jgi:hypothetical protein
MTSISHCFEVPFCITRVRIPVTDAGPSSLYNFEAFPLFSLMSEVLLLESQREEILETHVGGGEVVHAD